MEQTQDAFVKKMEARLDQLAAEVNKQRAQAQEIEADAELQWHSQLSSLQDELTTARQKLDELADAGTDAWQNMARGFEDAWHNVETGFERVQESRPS